MKFIKNKYLQHGTPALINTSGDITVVFSPRIENVTVHRKQEPDKVCIMCIQI
jgi:hypothetical protein